MNPKRRAVATNNPQKLVGVDMKSGHGRRFADIMTMLAIEYIGLDPVTLRELASLKLTLELTQLAVIEGDKRARGDLVRISNVISRRESQLRAEHVKAQAEAPSLSVRDLLAEHEAAKC